MKKVLSLLLAYAFLSVQLWAYAPNYPTSAASASGTYAGVITPTTVQTSKTSSSIGVFAIGVPPSTTGVAVCTGAAVIFANGAGYPAILNGVFDPESSTLTAIIEGSANSTSTTTTQLITDQQTGEQELVTSTSTNQIFAQGTLTATLQAAPMIKGSVTTGGPGTSQAERLDGTASIDLFSSTAANGTPNVTATVKYQVTGFQQSAVFTTPTIQIVIPGSSTSNSPTGT